MPVLSHSVPRYRNHEASGQAFARSLGDRLVIRSGGESTSPIV